MDVEHSEWLPSIVNDLCGIQCRQEWDRYHVLNMKYHVRFDGGDRHLNVTGSIRLGGADSPPTATAQWVERYGPAVIHLFLHGVPCHLSYANPPTSNHLKWFDPAEYGWPSAKVYQVHLSDRHAPLDVWEVYDRMHRMDIEASIRASYLEAVMQDGAC